MNNEPVAELVLEQMAVGDASSLRVKWLVDNYPPVGTKLYTHPANACKHGVDDGACKECYLESSNPYKAITNTKIEPTAVSYTHPVKENCCPDCGCHFTGEYPFNYTVKELTDEEIDELHKLHTTLPPKPWKGVPLGSFDVYEFARAILRKAQEK